MKNQNLKKFHRPEILKEFSHLSASLPLRKWKALHLFENISLYIYTPHETYSSQSLCHLSRINCTKLYRAENCVTKSRED